MERVVPVICPLTRGCAEALAEIDRCSNRVPWSSKLFEQEFDNSCSRTFGARAEGQLIAFLVCHVVLDEAHIISFGVTKEWQGYGIGRALLEAVLEMLDEDGVRTVTLEVREGNLVARSLYASLGFGEAGIRVGYYTDNGEDALLLRLMLDHF